MARFVLSINLGNVAMESPDDLADALEEVVIRVRERAEYPARIRDINGNTVGEWSIEP